MRLKFWTFCFVLVGLVSCSGSESDEDSKDEEASIPQEVSGSFLTMKCHNFDEEKNLSNTATHRIGCTVFDAEDQPVDLSIGAKATLEIETEDGTEIITIDEVLAGSDSYSFFFDLDANVSAKVTKVIFTDEATTAQADGITWEGLTNSLNAFAAEIQLRDAMDSPDVVVKKMHSTMIPDAGIAIRAKSFDANAVPAFDNDSHIMFASDFLVYPGSGVSFFDQVCTVSGSVLDHERQWKAIVSTDSEDAKDRIALSGKIFNAKGEMLFPDARVIFSDDPYIHAQVGELGTLRDLYTESGFSPAESLPGHSGILKLEFDKMWTGTTGLGAVSADETCSNWTSNDAEAYGKVARARHSTNTNLFEPAAEVLKPIRSCNQRARIMCISQ